LEAFGELLSLALPTSATERTPEPRRAGRLTRDTDPAGGFQQLSRVVDAAGRTVTVTTALGRATSYRLDDHADGGQHRQITLPDATSSVTDRDAADTRVSLAPDGTQTTSSVAPDPLFGGLSPYPSRVETRLPSGLTRLETFARTATLATLGDPLSLTSLTESRSLNGQTWATLWDAVSRVETTTSPMGRTTSRQLTALGQTAQAALPGVLPFAQQFDAFGRPTSSTQGTRTSSFGYDPASGFLRSLTDALAQTTTLDTDAVRREPRGIR
jgi:YD repeat-containing protein